MRLCYYTIRFYNLTIRFYRFYMRFYLFPNRFCRLISPFYHSSGWFIDSLESKLCFIVGECEAVRHFGAGDVCVPPSGLG